MGKALPLGDENDGLFVVASHEALFRTPDEAVCDACGAVLPPDKDGEALAPRGCGAFLWVRGDAVCLEDVPLCASCASAIGMTVLGRWEIEEEEG